MTITVGLTFFTWAFSPGIIRKIVYFVGLYILFALIAEKPVEGDGRTRTGGSRCKLVCFNLHNLVAEASSKSHIPCGTAWFAFHWVPRCLVLGTSPSCAPSTRV